MARFSRSRWSLLAGLLAAIVLVICLLSSQGPREPIYQGRRLSKWMEGHPRVYWPAVQAIGTNALPFLLAELQTTDSGLSRFAQRMLNKVSVGPFWRTARMRQYHARLALQILDTNAAPALLDTIFAQPMRVAEGDRSWEVAFVLNWLHTTEAQGYAQERLGQALLSEDSSMRRNACLAFATGFRPSTNNSPLLIALASDTNATVRAAAVRALLFWQPDDATAQTAIIALLNDEQAAVRRLAAVALGARGSNAVAALPALRTAYASELTHKSLTDDVDDEFRGPRYLSPESLRWAIRDAIQAIDPSAPLPGPSE